MGGGFAKQKKSGDCWDNVPTIFKKINAKKRSFFTYRRFKKVLKLIKILIFLKKRNLDFNFVSHLK